jgi:predicted ArsR family transcriptional regulator
VLLAARRTGQTPRAAGRSAGRTQAAAAGSEDTDAFDALEADAARQGFSPRWVERGRRVELVLDACPLANIASADPATVCAVHRGLAEGLVDAIGGAQIDGFVANDPHRAGCRVKVRRTT